MFSSSCRDGKDHGRSVSSRELRCPTDKLEALVPDPADGQTGPGGVARPMNGAEYLESLRDGRDIWIYGEKVGDVTTHPAFRNGVRSIARLYDALHDPATKDELTVPT